MKAMRLNITPERVLFKRDPMLYGHFLEHFHRQIYGGVYDPTAPFADEDGFRTDVLEALRRIRVPIIRWPGGCFAETYDWRDGVGPQDQRKRMVNTNWGYVVEDNSFGTHEFMDLCSQLGCEPYVNGNVGSVVL